MADTTRMERVYMPESINNILRSKSNRLGLPISRLICYAIDHELDRGEEAFMYDDELPKIEINDFDYAEEAGKISTYLNNYPNGLGIDSLIMARRDMKIETREQVKLGIMELLKHKIIERVKPRKSSTFKKFKDDYRKYRLVDEKRKDKANQLEKEAQRLLERANKMRGL